MEDLEPSECDHVSSVTLREEVQVISDTAS